MLIALPVAAVIVVLLRHARARYERSQFYGTDATITQHLDTHLYPEAHLSAAQVQLDIDVKNPQDSATTYDVDESDRGKQS